MLHRVPQDHYCWRAHSLFIIWVHLSVCFKLTAKLLCRCLVLAPELDSSRVTDSSHVSTGFRFRHCCVGIIMRPPGYLKNFRLAIGAMWDLCSSSMTCQTSCVSTVVWRCPNPNRLQQLLVLCFTLNPCSTLLLTCVPTNTHLLCDAFRMRISVLLCSSN